MELVSTCKWSVFLQRISRNYSSQLLNQLTPITQAFKFSALWLPNRYLGAKHTWRALLIILPQVVYGTVQFYASSIWIFWFLILNRCLLCITVDADEIRRLGKRFKKLDLDNSGSLSVDEFMSLPELQQNPLVQRVIDVFDRDGNGEVDFKGMLLFSGCINLLCSLHLRDSTGVLLSCNQPSLKLGLHTLGYNLHTLYSYFVLFYVRQSSQMEKCSIFISSVWQSLFTTLIFPSSHEQG